MLDNLSEKQYAIFGLGDITYDRFNLFAKNINKIFTKYKAHKTLDMGLGSDHEGDVKKYFDKWSRKCVKEFSKLELEVFKGNLKVFLESKNERLDGITLLDTPVNFI